MLTSGFIGAMVSVYRVKVSAYWYYTHLLTQIFFKENIYFDRVDNITDIPVATLL